jgi:hypothetical protein
MYYNPNSPHNANAVTIEEWLDNNLRQVRLKVVETGEVFTTEGKYLATFDSYWTGMFNTVADINAWVAEQKEKVYANQRPGSIQVGNLYVLDQLEAKLREYDYDD